MTPRPPDNQPPALEDELAKQATSPDAGSTRATPPEEKRARRSASSTGRKPKRIEGLFSGLIDEPARPTAPGVARKPAPEPKPKPAPPAPPQVPQRMEVVPPVEITPAPPPPPEILAEKQAPRLTPARRPTIKTPFREQPLSTAPEISTAALESLRLGRPVAENARPDQPAILAYARPFEPLSGVGTSLDYDAATGTAPSVEGAETLASALLLEVLDDHPGRVWSNDELTLVEQVTDQLSLALENARLFEETRQARDALEVSARYQKSVALAVATLTALGTPALPEVLQILGEAVGASRAYYIETHSDQKGPYWKYVNEWRAPGIVSLMETPSLGRISMRYLKPWIEKLNADGYIASITSTAPQAAKEFFEALGTRSTLQFAVRGTSEVSENLPGCIGFEQRDYDRLWSADEIAALQTAASALASTLARESLLKQVQANLTETEEQYQASAQLNAARDYEQILNILRQHSILGHSHASNVSLNLFEQPWAPSTRARELSAPMLNTSPENRPQWLVSVARWSTEPYTERPQDSYPQAPWLTNEGLLNADQAVMITDPAQDPRMDDNARSVYIGQLDAKSLAFIPLKVSERWIGHIIAVYSKPIEFSDQNVRHLLSLSGQAAVAVEGLRLLDETRQRNEELATINQITSAVSRTLELDEVLTAILQRVLSAIEYESGLISIADPISRVLSLAVHDNLPEALTQRLLEKGMAGTVCDLVYQTGQMIYIPNMDNLPEALKAFHTAFDGPKSLGFRSYLGVPLMSKGIRLGTVCAFSYQVREISEARLSLMEAISQQVGVVIDNARLFQGTQIALGETEALYQASAELNAVQSYDGILETLRKYTVLGDVDKLLSISLFNRPWLGGGVEGRKVDENMPERVVPVAHWTTLPPEKLRPRYDLKDYPAAWLLSPTDSLVIEDIQSDPRLDNETRRLYGEIFEGRSVLFTPLFVGGSWIGFLNAVYSASRTFEEVDLRRLAALASQAAVAVQNLRLLDESQRRANQLQTAAEIARDTSSTLALDTLLQRSVTLFCERFGYYHASIFLLDEDGLEAIIRESTGVAGDEMKRRSHRLPVGGRSVVGQVTATGRALVLNNVSAPEAQTIHQPNPLLPQTRAELGIPLKIGERVIGALDVQSTQADSFSEDDISVLQVLADQIAVALDNARSYEIAQKAVEEIREADRLKTQFLANMSHELRTPLNSIIGFSRVILKGIDGSVNEQQSQDLTAIYNSGQHLLGLINDVLDLSKIEAGKMELSFEENVNIADIIRSVMSTTIGLVKDKPIQLKQEISPDLPLLSLDPMKIRQVLINLLSNAAKFTDQGSITVDARPQNDPHGQPEVIVSIIDTGSGITPEDQIKLFQPFSQVDGSLTRKTGGSGLGLSICHHLVRMHGGRIGVHSQIGHGSTFYFTIPLHRPEILPDENLPPELPDVLQLDSIPAYETPSNRGETKEESTTAAIEQTVDVTPIPGMGEYQPPHELAQTGEVIATSADMPDKDFPDIPPAMVLAIDKDPQVIDLYRRYLTNHRYSVVALTELDQVLTVVRGIQPFAITLDVAIQFTPSKLGAEVPTGTLYPDGWSVLKELKTNPTTNNIPIIVCSLVDEREKAFDLGANAYLLKPILEDDLIEALQRLRTGQGQKAERSSTT